MSVIEDFEDVGGWADQDSIGTRTFQNTIAIVGNALEYEGTSLGNSKAFNVNEYGCYIRTDDVSQNYPFSFYLFNAAITHILFRLTVLANGNFATMTDAGDNVDIGVACAANTWYWLSLIRNGDHDTDIRIYNEARDTVLYSDLGTDNRDNNTWATGDSALYIRADSSGAAVTVHFDQLEDVGTPPPPPPVGGAMNMKGYW